MTTYTYEPSDNPFAVPQTGRTITGPVLRTFALVGLCCLAVYGLQFVSRHWLIGRLSFGLAEHPAHIQSERLAMLAEFGAAGLPALVEATISENQALSQNAYRTLSELQGRWATGARDDSPSMNLALVEAIAEASPSCPPDRRALLARLLNQTLLETVDSPHAKDRESYLRGQQLLAILGPESTNRSRSAATNDQPGLANRPVSLNQQPNSSNSESGVSTSDLLNPGSLLPPLPTRLLAVDESNPTSDADPKSNPNWLSADQFDPIKATEPQQKRESNPLVRDTRADLTNSNTNRLDADPLDQITDNPLATYDIRSVIDFLASPQPSLVRAAEQELRARKLTDSDLQMAHRLMSPDPEVRLAMIKELPSRTDVDPRTWLLWLSADIERMVRLEAISVLGTMNDPNIQAALRDRLTTERDLIVAMRLRKILGLR